MTYDHQNGLSKRRNRNASPATLVTGFNTANTNILTNSQLVSDIHPPSPSHPSLPCQNGRNVNYNEPKISGNDAHDNATHLATAISQVAFPSWTSMALMFSLIFGGCCSNVSTMFNVDMASCLLTSSDQVFALEAIIK